jgi:hypothetical protein
MCIAANVLISTDSNLLSDHTLLVKQERMTFSHHVDVYIRKGHDYVPKCQAYNLTSLRNGL